MGAASGTVSDSGTVRVGVPVNAILQTLAFLMAGLLVAVVANILFLSLRTGADVRALRAELSTVKAELRAAERELGRQIEGNRARDDHQDEVLRREIDTRSSLAVGDLVQLRDALISGGRPPALMSTMRATALSTERETANAADE